jgi:membrane-bound ClpP family serine protease
MNNRRLTVGRLIVAVVTTGLEEVAIWAIWRWALPEWDINLSVNVLIGVMVAWGVFSVTLFILTTRILRKQVPAGLPSMVGTRGKATGKLSPEGMVRIKGELWTATASNSNIVAGDEIEVVGEDGLRLVVEKRGADKPKR